MRYFPERARRKANTGAKLNVCTYCLGDLFADGRCVQCHARIAFGSVREPLTSPIMTAPVMIVPVVGARPILN